MSMLVSGLGSVQEFQAGASVCVFPLSVCVFRGVFVRLPGRVKWEIVSK